MSFFEPKTPKNQGINAIKAHAEHGGALIWIMIMVALFASLSYIVSQGSRGGTSQIGDKQAELAAVEILDYARGIKNAVHQLQINGCSADEIDFGNDIYKRYNGTSIEAPGTNTLAPTDGSCGVFRTNGGGLRPHIFKNTSPVSAPTNTFMAGHGTTGIRDIIGIGTDGIDDITFHWADIHQDVCLAINKLIGMNSTPSETVYSILGDEDTNIAGKNIFCYYRNAPPERNFMHIVLIPR